VKHSKRRNSKSLKVNQVKIQKFNVASIKASSRCNAKALSEVIWTSFLGIVHLEKSKRAMSRKNHLKITQDLALEVLSRGVVQ